MTLLNTLEKCLVPKSKKCNLGCGDIILDGWVNVDKYNPKADFKADVLDLPFVNGCFDEVILSHVIEHVPYKKHVYMLDEIHRVMEDGGKLVIGFPDFMETAKNFIENKNGERWTWWIQTLYGTQSDEGQFHVAPVTTKHLIHQLTEVGFDDFVCETDNGYDMVLTCKKTESLPWHMEEGSWTGVGL